MMSAEDSQTVNVPVRRGGDGRRRRRGEQAMVPDAEFASYYGRPVIKEPSWEAPDVPGYLFLGGLAALRRYWRPAPSCPATASWPAWPR